MSDEIPFEEWYEKFKTIRANEGLPPFEDEGLAELMHLEGLTPEAAVADSK